MDAGGGVGKHGLLPEAIKSGLDLLDKIEQLKKADPTIKPFMEQSIQVLEQCLRMYGVDGTAFSFNAGKDSTVVLHLLRAAVTRLYVRKAEELRVLEQQEPQTTPELELEAKRTELQGIQLQNVPIIYFEHDNEFTEIRDFVSYLAEQYNVGYRVFTGKFEVELEVLLKETSVKAILMGVRKGDPYSEHLEHFAPSSEGWPLFMRINPILKWEYRHVWQFLRGCELNYCCLYDEGYTSLGKIVDTERNPALRQVDSSGNVTYLPAYALKNGSQERVGRKKKMKQKSSMRIVDKVSGIERNRTASEVSASELSTVAVVVLNSAAGGVNVAATSSCSISGGEEHAKMTGICQDLNGLLFSVPQVTYLVPTKDALEREAKHLAAQNTYVIFIDPACESCVADSLDTVFPSFEQVAFETGTDACKILLKGNTAVFSGDVSVARGHLGDVLDKLELSCD
jgi:FAD synthetase